MSEALKFWAVVKDGRGKWVVKYDPKEEIKDGERFAFGATANEYAKKMTKKDAEAKVERAGTQRSFGDAS